MDLLATIKSFFLEFLLDLELCSVPLQKQYMILIYCLENPPVESRVTLQVFAQKRYWLKQLYFLFPIATKDQQGEMASPQQWILLCNLHLMLRPAEAEAYL